MAIKRLIRTSVWLGVFLVFLVVAVAPAHAAKAVTKAPGGKNKDLVVVDYERWLDTLKGTVKNFSKGSARDVTVMVRFLDKRRKVLGTQRVSVGDLRSGDQSSWSLAIEERNRPGTQYVFEVHAIWQ